MNFDHKIVQAWIINTQIKLSIWFFIKKDGGTCKGQERLNQLNS